MGMVVGALLGLTLPISERLFPKAARFNFSATGLGLSMFIAALVTLILQNTKPKLADQYIVPVASGIIAGESLMGVAVAVALLTAAHFL